MQVCFPDVPSGQHMEEMVKVHNLNQELPAVIEIPSSAYFHADQSRIRLEPGQTVTVVISYTPKSMGRHTARLSCPVTTPSGAFLQECVLSLQGQSLTHDVGLGTTKGPAGRAPLPEDFVKPRVRSGGHDALSALSTQLQYVSSWADEVGWGPLSQPHAGLLQDVLEFTALQWPLLGTCVPCDPFWLYHVIRFGCTR